MDSREIVRRLGEDGWQLARVRGSQDQFTHPGRPGRVTIVHPLADIPTGTLRSIFRQAGWDWRER